MRKALPERSVHKALPERWVRKALPEESVHKAPPVLRAWCSCSTVVW